MTNEQYQGLLKHFMKDTSNSKDVSNPNVNMVGKKVPNRSWIIDTGVTNHMTSDQTFPDKKV